MSVTFLNVVFENTTGFDLPLTIEAPIGAVAYGPNIVVKNTNVDIPIRRDNCLSVRLIAEERDHGATQDFVLVLPEKGRGSYLERVEAKFTVADITGRVTARTEGIAG
ncbi:hypothetical protein ABIB00_005449 [Bradyrhizobium sp. LB14.3]|uniref:hypothetical protein n=1 Tax=Bradyrhizobium sp. LB14.3 TaxID=3156328 RepID=UPI0033974CE6